MFLFNSLVMFINQHIRYSSKLCINVPAVLLEMTPKRKLLIQAHICLFFEIQEPKIVVEVFILSLCSVLLPTAN